MKSIIINSSIVILLVYTTTAQSIQPFFQLRTNDLVNKSFSIELKLKPGQLKDSGTIYFSPVDYIVYNQITEIVKVQDNGTLKIWKKVKEPGYINFSNILNIKQRGHYLTEPGDDVVVRLNSIGFEFSGNGAKKYELQYRLDSIERSISKVSTKTGIKAFYLDSLGEFFAWKNYCQEKMDKGLLLFKEYEKEISEYAFAQINDRYINEIHSKLSEKFGSLIDYGAGGKNIQPSTLVKIYDSTFSPTVEKWQGYVSNGQMMQMSRMKYLLDRAFYFDPKRMLSQDEVALLLFKDLFHVYQGKERERLAVNSFPKGLMLSRGFTPEVEQLLGEYYATPGFPEWKKWMKEKELEIRVKKISNQAPVFSLPDNNGRLISNKDLIGKTAIMCFQSDDAKSLRKTNVMLQKVAARFSKTPEVVVLNIHTEKDNAKWQKEILTTKAKNIINISTGGMGIEHSIIKDYAITSYPWIWVIGPNGKILNADDPINDNLNDEKLLTAFIQKKNDHFKIEKQKAISASKDGPYVFYQDNSCIAYFIDNKMLNKMTIKNIKNQAFWVQTDLDKKFAVTLQKSNTIQPSEYSEVEKLLALSDIEGNFDAFRKLLQRNKIIDDNFNWTFGKGHLVFAGDMFDRGNQVTECLWLLYSLEEKAKSVGGYVHFILGNHEIMNMEGHHQYSAKKYSANAILMGKTLTELYNEGGEIGRWLRTKNIIEKIDNILFLHAGISPEVSKSLLSIDDINKIARPYYGRKIDSTEKDLLMIYDSRIGEGYRVSPFWSRAYYKGNKISNNQLDSTLQKFNVRRIVTGHTIVADTISLHYNKKVINIDTKHKDGKSEALFIEGGCFYRVNSYGKKVLLFVDEKLKRIEKSISNIEK